MGTKQASPWAARPAVALMGPTGVGKSALALELAESTGAHLINCDSVQCYRHFDIGSAKPSARERQRVPHHLLDVADARFGGCDAHFFVAAARAHLAALAEQGTATLLCGGTGLYVRALRDGLIDVPFDAALRADWRAREAGTPGAIAAALAAADPRAAARIDARNPARLLRALEITLLSGRPASAVWAEHSAARAFFPLAIVVLEAPGPWLRARLQARAEAMVAAGLVSEVAALLASGVPDTATPMRSVGYREAVAVLRGELAAEALMAAVAQRSWQYVRRQRTWLRKEAIGATLSAPELAARPRAERLALTLAAIARAQAAFQAASQ